MIDREGRDRLALALRRYAIGRIDSDTMDGQWPDWRDRGARAVHQMQWNLYSDGDGRAVGRAALGWSTRREIARWILFLRTDQEYLWPEHRLDVPDLIGALARLVWPFGRRRFLNLGTFQTHWNRRTEQFLEAGDPAVWPFINRAAYDEACAQWGKRA